MVVYLYCLLKFHNIELLCLLFSRILTYNLFIWSSKLYTIHNQLNIAADFKEEKKKKKKKKTKQKKRMEMKQNNRFVVGGCPEQMLELSTRYYNRFEKFSTISIFKWRNKIFAIVVMMMMMIKYCRFASVVNESSMISSIRNNKKQIKVI